ncbi:MAG: hypothetical protein ACFCUQ_22795 [Kiloniellales bacterium]
MGGFLLKVRRSRSDPNIVAMLSLYLLLLAFFILLNALSKLEDDRTRTVLKSVNEAFNGNVQSLDSVKSYSAALGPLDQSGGLLSDIQKLFESSIPAAETEMSDSGTLMRLTLDSESLFRPGRPEVQPKRKAFLEQLAKILMTERNDGLVFELEVMHGVPEDKAGIVAEAGPRSLEVRRMGVLVSAFESLTLPPPQLSVGISPGHPNEVLLIIRVFEKQAEPIELAPTEPLNGGREGAADQREEGAEPASGEAGDVL